MKPRYTPLRETTYVCPMHPKVEQHRPGNCPKCGMALVTKLQGRGGPGGHSGRPMHQHEEERAEGQKTQESPAQEDHGSMPEMIRQMRAPWLWTNGTIIMLGFWLVSSPFTFGYAGTRMMWNDVISGLLLASLAGAALSPRFDFLGRWGAAFVGTWLQLAPLVFWATAPVAFATDTLVGALAITFSVLVPMMPGMAHHMEMKKPGPEIPPGWSYNPSSWHQRVPMIVAAFLGWMISRYLAAFQLGYIHSAWDPFFGSGAEKVLTSKVSQMLPVSDAGLGAFAYTFEFLMAWMGGRTRWRSMPWMVTFFFILVVPLGATSIVLVILQPVSVGHWCTLCLATALIMLLMIPFTVDEVVAMGQFLKQSVRDGKPFWRTFWIGGSVGAPNQDTRTPRYGAPAEKAIPAALWGVSAPWNLLLSAALGIWLMFAPALFGAAGRVADSDHVVGALITTFAVIAMAEVFRAGRFLNLLLGAWIVASPWFLSSITTSSRWNDVVTGLLVVALSIPRGTVRQKYAGWDSFIV